MRLSQGPARWIYGPPGSRPGTARQPAAHTLLEFSEICDHASPRTGERRQVHDAMAYALVAQVPDGALLRFERPMALTQVQLVRPAIKGMDHSDSKACSSMAVRGSSIPPTISRCAGRRVGFAAHNLEHYTGAGVHTRYLLTRQKDAQTNKALVFFVSRRTMLLEAVG